MTLKMLAVKPIFQKTFFTAFIYLSTAVLK